MEAGNLHTLLFSPEIQKPIKTLDLPLGGSKGVRTAIQVLIDFLLIANKNQQDKTRKIEDYADDDNGETTITVLKRAIDLAGRITGNSNGSLGLHPAIYFYGPTGRHSSSMFLGTVSLIGEKLLNNNKRFFNTFTTVRGGLENILIRNKELIATILQKCISRNRVEKHKLLLDRIIITLINGEEINEEKLITFSELDGKIIAGDFSNKNTKISHEQKSKLFINVALNCAITCPICNGFLDIDKSVSYDHIQRVRDGGVGVADNIQLTHPYCNQSYKQ